MDAGKNLECIWNSPEEDKRNFRGGYIEILFFSFGRSG